MAISSAMFINRCYLSLPELTSWSALWIGLVLDYRINNEIIWTSFRKLLDRFNIRGEDQKLLIRFLWVCSFKPFAIDFRIAGLGFWTSGRATKLIKSFWDGIWWAIVTIATVGYGDKYPVTYQGRFVVSFWLLWAILHYLFNGFGCFPFVEDRLKGAKGLKR